MISLTLRVILIGKSEKNSREFDSETLVEWMEKRSLTNREKVLQVLLDNTVDVKVEGNTVTIPSKEALIAIKGLPYMGRSRREKDIDDLDLMGSNISDANILSQEWFME